jgi:hypothetical protein
MCWKRHQFISRFARDHSFPENPIVLPVFGALFAAPCFWIITQRPALQQAGRFILLTYVRPYLAFATERVSSLQLTTEPNLPLRVSCL